MNKATSKRGETIPAGSSLFNRDCITYLHLILADRNAFGLEKAFASVNIKAGLCLDADRVADERS